ncbi:hypothetical protein NLJ89_g7277 [Agrocybe chaxingu]|uniref:protein-tyrosine-phosphatase n=1 Tax=Agrocybe chaxingu TaxID=84603 RepID=A0A9W8K4S9_9AGAR|nr:hypothetical protein NLJ89_g7277 [Agrocybe chaxingu]
MDEIIPGLWIGDLASALNVEKLKEHGIFSILTAMRGSITIHETFIRHQIKVDDSEDADILAHFLPSIHFIQAELDKGRGVLVHCQAGVSRSSTIVAAYLMYSQKIDPQTALEIIRQARPFVEPNQGFLQQLELFHEARYKISKREKAVRKFYMDRTVEEVMNGDGSPPETNMFASYPRTPSDSVPNTPGGPRRRIRCKMCRQELAAREHMLDHGQLGPPTPAGLTPAPSRRPSQSKPATATLAPSNGTAPEPVRRPSRKSFSTALGDSLSMSSIREDPGNQEPEKDPASQSASSDPTARNTPAPTHPLISLRSMSLLDPSSLSMSALDVEDDTEGEPVTAEDLSIDASRVLGRRLSDAVIATPQDTPQSENKENSFISTQGGTTTEGGASETKVELSTTQFISPTDLAAQLYTNPKLAALRSLHGSTATSPIASKLPIVSAPILANPKCSGYFVEPMKWMEHFLSEGQLAGKITCPNKKCGAKLGNYDWAGAGC